MRYALTQAAVNDVREITQHIRTQQQSPQNARLVATRLRNHFRLLAARPQIGHVREELGDDSLRVSAVTGLLVIYDPLARPLIILRVIHPRRDLGRINPRA